MSRSKPHGQRNPRPRRTRRRAAGSADQASTPNDSGTPPPHFQDGEPVEVKEPEHLVAPTPAPRTSARQPTMPLQATLRNRRSAQESPQENAPPKGFRGLVNGVGAPANPEAPKHEKEPEDVKMDDIDGSELADGDNDDNDGDDGGGNNNEDGENGASAQNRVGRPAKRRRVLGGLSQEGDSNGQGSASADVSVVPTVKAGRNRTRAGAKTASSKEAEEEEGKPRARVRRPKGSRSGGGPGSRGGKGAYKPRKPKVKDTGGSSAAAAPGPVVENGDSSAAGDAARPCDWASTVRRDLPATRSSSINLPKMNVAIASSSSALAELKERQAAILDEAKPYTRAIVALDRERATKALKELKADKDFFRKTPYFGELERRLDQTADDHVEYLKDQLVLDKRRLRNNYEADRWAAREVFETEFVNMCERCIEQFLHEETDISELWKVQDPYLNEFVLQMCGLDNLEQVTMTDLIETFIGRDGRDRTVWDRDQMATRSNQGLYDRKVIGTATARARKVASDIVHRELGGIADVTGTPEIMREAEAHRREWAGSLQFVRDSSYDTNNPAQFVRPRRFTTREAFAVDGLTIFNSADLEFRASEESSANEESCEVDGQVISESNELREPAGPRPPVRLPPRQSLLSNKPGGARPSFLVRGANTLPAIKGPTGDPVAASAVFTGGPSVGRVDAIGQLLVSGVGASANSRIYSGHAVDILAGEQARAITPSRYPSPAGSNKRLRDGTRKQTPDPSKSASPKVTQNPPAAIQAAVLEYPKPTVGRMVSNGYEDQLQVLPAEPNSRLGPGHIPTDHLGGVHVHATRDNSRLPFSVTNGDTERPPAHSSPNKVATRPFGGKADISRLLLNPSPALNKRDPPTGVSNDTPISPRGAQARNGQTSPSRRLQFAIVTPGVPPRAKRAATDSALIRQAPLKSVASLPQLTPRLPALKPAQMNPSGQYPGLSYGPSTKPPTPAPPHPNQPYPGNAGAPQFQPPPAGGHAPQIHQGHQSPGWLGAGYTYSGPQPPPTQFQSPVNYNYDNSSLGYQPHEIPTEGNNNRLLPQHQPPPQIPAYFDYNAHPNAGYTHQGHGPQTSRQIPYQPYASQYNGPTPQEPGWSGAPHGRESWAPMVPHAGPPAPPPTHDTRPVAAPPPTLSASPHPEVRAASTESAPTPPVKFYVGAGIYKTAPAPLPADIPTPRLTPHGAGLEEDLYPKDRNIVTENGSWMGQPPHP